MNCIKRTGNLVNPFYIGTFVEGLFWAVICQDGFAFDALLPAQHFLTFRNMAAFWCNFESSNHALEGAKLFRESHAGCCWLISSSCCVTGFISENFVCITNHWCTAMQYLHNTDLISWHVLLMAVFDKTLISLDIYANKYFTFDYKPNFCRFTT